MAARSLGTLTADLVLKMGGFTKGMDQASRETANFEKKVSANFRAAGQSFQRLAGVLGVGLGLEALRRTAAAAIEYGDEINKASIKTGVGVEALSELAYAAKQTDIDLTSLSTAFKKMQVTLSEAGSGSKTANETLQALGLTIQELKALAPEDQFELLADRIAALKSPADKTRAAVELFGKAGADLLPLFEDGARGIRELRDEAQRMGATLTGEQAKALADTDDAIKRLKATFSGFARTLTAEVAPGLSQVFENLNAFLTGDVTGKAISKLRYEIEFLQQMQGRSFVSVGYGDIGTGFFTAAEGAEKLLELEKQLDQIEQKRTARFAPGGHSRTPSTPGYLEGPPKTPRGSAATSTAAERAGLQELAVTSKQITVSATEQLYREMDEATQTSMEQQLSAWEEFDTQINELLAAGRITTEQANARIAENAAQYLEPITITAKKIFPPEEQEKLSEFWIQASRNTQDILANFLEDPFKDGIKGLLQSFGDMLKQMAAQAIAADIAGKIFGSGGAGSGGGWLGAAMNWAGSFFDSGGYTGSGGKFEPAGIVHRDEYVMPKERVREPGALGFLRKFHAYGMDFLGSLPGFADGGLVTAGVPQRIPGAAMVKSTNRTPGNVSVTNNFTIQAPGGRVAAYTESQIAAAAARGVARASMRDS